MVRRCAPSNPAFKSSPCGQGRRASPTRRARQFASLIEAQVNGIVEKLLIDPERLPRLRFEQTVRLMIALGASVALSEPLIELGRIRNAFGHRVDTRLTMAMIDKWISSFSEGDRAMIDRAVAKTSVDLGQPAAKLDEHDPKSRFILISVFLRQVLRQMQVELDAKRAAT